MQIVRNVLAGILQFPLGATSGLLFVAGFFAFLSQVFLWLKYNHWFSAHQLVKSSSAWHGVPSVYTNEELAVQYLSRFGPAWLDDWKGLEQTLVWLLSCHPVVIALFLSLLAFLVEILFGSNNLRNLDD